MLRTPQISLFATAHRPQNWANLYESIGDNNISFEIIFVGPNKPDFELPSNFKYIQSYTKPAQCAEIASRYATGELVMSIADDCEFRAKHPLDMLYNTYNSYNNDKLILSCRYMKNGEDRTDELRFSPADKNSPIVPVGGLLSRKLYRDIGGIDRNFIAVCWDIDIAMRVLALGGEVLLSDVYINEQQSRIYGSQLYFEFSHRDRKLLESLWTTGGGGFELPLYFRQSSNGQVNFNRARPVEPFSDLRIHEVSQGPRGRWRGTSPVILEKLADSSWRLKQYFWGRAYAAMINLTKYPAYVKRISRRLLRK